MPDHNLLSVVLELCLVIALVTVGLVLEWGLLVLWSRVMGISLEEVMRYYEERPEELWLLDRGDLMW